MTTAQAEPRTSVEHKGTTTLLLIALFKLLKGIALIAVGIGALKLLGGNVADTVAQWINFIRVDPDNRLVHSLLARVLKVSPNQLKALSIGTFIYSGLLLTEGAGLLLRKRWAEYFTIITTAGLIPLELYEISRHMTAGKIVVLILNVAIVVYLVVRVRHPHDEKSA